MSTSFPRSRNTKTAPVRKHRPARARLELTALEERMVPASTYDIQWLGHLSATDTFSAAQGINDNGQVVGNSYLQDANGIPTDEKAFLYTPGVGLTDLGTAGATGAFAWDINSTGKVTGWVHEGGSLATGGYWEWAAIWDNGVGHTIPGYGQAGMSSAAYGVNDNNIVVGHSDIPYSGGNGEAYTYDGSTLNFLGTLGGRWSYAMDINNTNWVAGFADTGENPSRDPNVYVSRYHATIWSPTGVIKDLGTLGTDSYAYKINASGQAVGSSIAKDGFYHAFLYDGMRMIDIGIANANTEALAINDKGQIVGDTVNWLNSTAFLYENGTRYDLNTLVNGLGTDTITSAHDINNLGQIVGYGLHDGRYEAYVLSPGNGGPTNSPPTANAGGVYSISEGQSVTLDASASSDPDGDTLTFTWDVNGDGVYGDAAGAASALTWSDLQALGVAAGSTYTVSVQVNDGQGHTATASTTLTVDSASSGLTGSVSGPTDGFDGVSGQERTLVLGAADPSQSTGFEFSIDWGDGSDEGFYADPGVEVSHVYEASGTYTVTVTVTDDAGLSDTVAVTLHIHEVEQQGDVLAVGGTAADDVITLAAGPASGTVVTASGTFATNLVMVYGGDGTDEVVIQGTAGNNSFGISSDGVDLNGFVVQGDSAETWVADGLAGDDTFHAIGTTLPVTLLGGDGNDRFRVAAGGAVNGKVDGGAGSDTLDYAIYQSPAAVDLQNETASGTAGFVRIEGFVGSNKVDTLTGRNEASTWAMDGYDGGTVNGVRFSSFENWVGGSGTDTFKIGNFSAVYGVIDGGAGVNTLDYSASTAGVVVDLSAGTAAGARSGVANIANVYGGSGADTLTGDAGDNVLLGNGGNDVLNGGPGGNDVLVGGAGDDGLTGSAGRNILIGGLGKDTINGGGGEDILIGGYTSYDANVQALQALMAEWKQTGLTYQERISHLTGETAGGANGTVYLKTKTVKDDKAADRLTGGDGLDWFWGLAAEIADLKSGERRN